MPEVAESLRELEARSVSDVLEFLAALRRGGREGERQTVPAITLHLRSGRDLTGLLLDKVAGPDGRGQLLLQRTDAGQGGFLDAAFLPLDSVEAITVHDAASFAARREGAPAPGRLDLRRRALELETALAEAVGARIPCECDLSGVAEGEGSRRYAELIQSAQAVLREVASDELGKRALTDKVRSVRLALGPFLAVKLDGQRLDLAAPAGGPLSRAELRVAIEQVL